MCYSHETSGCAIETERSCDDNVGAFALFFVMNSQREICVHPVSGRACVCFSPCTRTFNVFVWCRPRLAEGPDVIISTPARLLQHIKAGNVNLSQSLETIVVDEADLLLSFGFEGDMRGIIGHIPRICQGFLMSATLSEDVQNLKKLVLHNPVILKLEGSDTDDSGRLIQYFLRYFSVVLLLPL